MKCFRKLTLTGYTVKYVDLREPKPRAVYEEVYTVDGDTKGSFDKLGLNLTDYIRDRYERGGYVCCSIERIKARRQVDVDLRELWEIAAHMETPEEYEAITTENRIAFMLAAVTACCMIHREPPPDDLLSLFSGGEPESNPYSLQAVTAHCSGREGGLKW